MAKLEFRDENNKFIPVVQDVKVNGISVFDGEQANITIVAPDVDKAYVDAGLSEKQDSLVSGENIKTINDESILGEGNIEIQSGVDTAVIPYELVNFDPKYGGDNQFLTIIGGLDNLEKIKNAIKNKTALVVEYDNKNYFEAITSEISEDTNPTYWFSMTVVFFHRYEKTFYTFVITGRETSDFEFYETNMPSLLGQISENQYWRLESLNVPIGTSAYVQNTTLEGTISFSQYAIGELIDTVYIMDYPIGFSDTFLQALTEQDLTSKAVIEQGENEIIVSYRPDPLYNEYNVFDWQVIERSMGKVISNKHYVYLSIPNSYRDYQTGWNIYDELSGELTAADYYEDIQPIRFYSCRKKEIVQPTYSQYNVENKIEVAYTRRNGSYRYKEYIDEHGDVDVKWQLEYPATQANFYEQDEQSPAFIKNKPSIWLPDLPNDASNKTYILKAINGVLEWTLDSGSGGGIDTYIYSFQEQNWEQNNGKYILRITTSQHTLGVNCYVTAVEKIENNTYQSTMFSYDRMTNGTIIINSSLPFNGRAILQEG